MKLSIVTTLFCSSKHIKEFHERVTKQASKITPSYEIIFVDDGSPDDSLKQAISLKAKDDKVKIIQLSRNFGHHKAIMTGLSHACGEYVFLIDSDLEEDPALLVNFWEEINSDENVDVDVVYGIQKKRKGGFFERITGGFFWGLMNFLSPIKIPSNMITARLMKKNYVDSLISYQESEVFIGGLYAHAGFNQMGVLVSKASQSPTTYTFKKKVGLLVNSITSFSSKPLVYIFYMGVFVTIVSVIFILKLIYNKLFNDISFEGWTSLIVSVWFLGGVIILTLGIIGIYISKLFNEVKNRPYTIIKKIHN